MVRNSTSRQGEKSNLAARSQLPFGIQRESLPTLGAKQLRVDVSGEISEFTPQTMTFSTRLRRNLGTGALLCLVAACQSTPNAPTDRFDLADLNHDQCLSQDEISDMIVTQVYTARNTNHDGKLTKSQWDVPGDEAGNKMFRGADTNHDGVVTLEEAKAYGRKIGVGKTFFKEADTNGDGCVDRAEARAYYASKEGPAR
jgi:Ca2+-binding EF-hand superfamily protein